MSRFNKTNFKALYGSSGSVFPDNTTGEISESDIRAFGNDIADSGLIPVDFKAVDTSGGTLTLDFEGFSWRTFVENASFSSPKTIALSNSSNAMKLTCFFTITNVSAILTFPSIFKMSDARWDSIGKTFTPIETGYYKITADFDSDFWIMDISNSVYI